MVKSLVKSCFIYGQVWLNLWFMAMIICGEKLKVQPIRYVIFVKRITMCVDMSIRLP